MARRLASLLSGTVAVALLMTVPALAQGKSQQDHGKSGGTNTPAGNSNSGKNSGGGGRVDPSPPSQIALAAPTGASTATSATPFAWIDNANLMAPGAVWVGISMVRWQNAGLSETSIPVVDAAFGVAPRLQIGASVPRVRTNSEVAGQQGGVGTTFLNGKIGILNNSERPLKLAVTPTLEILSQSSMQWMPSGQHRVQWGLPVSAEFDRGVSRVYGSTGYFSPGVWYTGAGAGTQVSSRVGVTLSFSRAWSTSALADLTAEAPARHDISTGVSVDLTPNVGLFGSVGRTIKTAPQYGAGTTFSIGLSLAANQITFKP